MTQQEIVVTTQVLTGKNGVEGCETGILDLLL